MGDSGRRVPADRLQHRTDALDNGYRGTRGDRVHAYRAVVAVLGVVLRRALLPAGGVAGVGRCGRGGGVLPVLPRARGPGTGAAGVLDRGRHLRAVRGYPALRQAHRAHAGAAQLGAGGRDHRRLPDSCRDLRLTRHLGGRGGGTRRLRHRGRLLPLHPAGRRLVPDRGLRGVLGRRRRDQPDPLQLGPRQGLWNGRTGRLHSGRGGRNAQTACPDRLHLRPDPRRHGTMEGLVAHRACRPVGRLLHRRDARDGPPGGALRHLHRGRYRHPRPFGRGGPGQRNGDPGRRHIRRGHRAHGRVGALWGSRSWACGCSSRLSWTSSTG